MAHYRVTPSGVLNIERMALRRILAFRMGMTTAAADSILHRWYHFDEIRIKEAEHIFRKAIYDHVDVWRKGSFEKYLINMGISPVPGASKLWYPIPGLGLVLMGYEHYSFESHNDTKSSKIMKVRYHNGFMEVRFGGGWQLLTTYLDEVLLAATKVFDPVDLVTLQREYWKENGNTFKFLLLPPELRNCIYDMVHASEVHPFPTHRLRNLRPLDTVRLGPTYRNPLMRVNRQVRSEAHHQLYMRTNFIINLPPIMYKFVRIPIVWLNIRHLTLALTHSQMFDVFRFNPKRSTACYNVNQHLRLLDLETLTLFFGPTSKIAEYSWLESACQKQAVKWILRAALPTIAGQNVVLKGFIKKSQKQLWDEHFERDRKAFLAYLAGNKVDVGVFGKLEDWDEFRSKGQKGGKIPTESKFHLLEDASLHGVKRSLRCNCAVHCTSGEWTSESDDVEDDGERGNDDKELEY